VDPSNPSRTQPSRNRIKTERVSASSALLDPKPSIKKIAAPHVEGRRRGWYLAQGSSFSPYQQALKAMPVMKFWWRYLRGLHQPARTGNGDTSFDMIHAHDWMTYPAGVALSELTGKPLVVHVHSLEYDRSGHSVNPQIDQIERLGTNRASLVIAVSYYTAAVVQREHGVAPEKSPLYITASIHTKQYGLPAFQGLAGEICSVPWSHYIPEGAGLLC
jgi:hypothetical protein